MHEAVPSTSLVAVYDISPLGQFTVICVVLTTCQKRHNRELGMSIERWLRWSHSWGDNQELRKWKKNPCSQGQSVTWSQWKGMLPITAKGIFGDQSQIEESKRLVFIASSVIEPWRNHPTLVISVKRKINYLKCTPYNNTYQPKRTVARLNYCLQKHSKIFTNKCYTTATCLLLFCPLPSQIKFWPPSSAGSKINLTSFV